MFLRGCLIVSVVSLLTFSIQASFIGMSQKEVLEVKGEPRAIYERKKSSLIQYEDVVLKLERDRVISQDDKDFRFIPNTAEFIILDAGTVFGMEALGTIAAHDGMIRGGTYQFRNFEADTQNFLSLSGDFNPNSFDLRERDSWQNLNSLRKVYLKFTPKLLEHSHSVLLLHCNSGPIKTDGRGEVIHVFALRPVLEYLESFQIWDENSVTWSNAHANSPSYGVDLNKAEHIGHQSVDQNSFTENQTEAPLRFELPNLFPFVQQDGSIHLVVTLSNNIELNVYSKDASVPDRLKPRLILK